MANGIKGITIEIGGDTTGLENSLKDVNKQSKDLQQELKEVDKALKLDPGNVELVRQKQELLTASIGATSEKLDALKTAQSQVEAQFQRGDIGVEQYRAFQRELQSTEGEMNRLQGQLNSLGTEQDRLAQTTRQLGTFFEATNTDVEQFAGTLGTRLTQAIRDGSATADQMERALRLMGQQALGASADIDQMREALRTVDNGASLDQIRQDLSQIGNAADEAGDEVNGFGDNLKNVVAGLAAGGGIAGAITAALDTSSLNTKIDITLDVPEASKESVRQAIKGVEAYGVDAEAALEGVRRQWALNADATDESNAKVIKSAGAIAGAYSSIDFNELIQEANEMSKTFGITDDEALGLVNSLLKIGFPPEQLDIIGEYGNQLKMAGYNATEIQAIMAAGVETGSWNIDILLDGVKEGRIVMAEFGVEVDKAMLEVINGTDISAKQLQTWGKAVAEGGEGGTKAMQEVAKAVADIDDKTKQNQVGVKIFGTLWEENGTNITDTILNMDNHMVSAQENQIALNDAVEKMNDDPAVKLKNAMNDMLTALQPILTETASFIANLAEWASENSKLVATIVSVGTAVGVLVGGFALLTPAIGTIVTLFTGGGIAFAGFGAAAAALAGPIGIAVGVIASLGAIYVLTTENADKQLKKDLEIAESNLNVAESYSKVLEEKSADIDKTSELINKTIEQADSIGTLTTSFEGLFEKSNLSREEFAKFLDLQSELEATTAPQKVEELEQRMDALREKSGLSNEEFDKLLATNSSLVEMFPQAGEVVGEYGNRIADTTGKLQEMTQAELDRMGIEVYNQMISDLEAVNAEIGNYETLLGEIIALEDSVNEKKSQQKSIQKDISDNESKIISNNEKIAELKQRQKEDSGQEYFKLEAQKNELKAQNGELETKNKKNDKNLEVLNETLSTEEKTLNEKKKQSDTTSELITKNRNNLDNYTQILSKNLGINIEKGKEIQSLDEAIAKNQKSIDQLQIKIKNEGDSNGKKQEGIQKLEQENQKITEAKTKLDAVIKNVETQNSKFDQGQVKLAKVNGEFETAKSKTDENIKKADIWNETLGKKQTKDVEIKQSKDPDDENRKWSSSIKKIVNIVVDGAKSLFGYADGTDYHPGGMAFMGEEGFELFKANGKYGIANFGLYDLPQGAKVWTHDETKQILGSEMMRGSSDNLQTALNNAYSSLASSAAKSGKMTTSRAMPSTSTIDNSKYMQPSITIINQVPNASPSELARKAIQAQRQLAMEWGV